MTFSGSQVALPPELCQRMVGRSWQDDPRCPRFEALRLLTLTYWDCAGAVAEGQLVVAEPLADEVLAIFAGLFDIRFSIARMELIDAFGVVAARKLRGIACGSKSLEVDPFDHLSIAHVETGDDPFGQHEAISRPCSESF